MKPEVLVLAPLWRGCSRRWARGLYLVKMARGPVVGCDALARGAQRLLGRAARTRGAARAGERGADAASRRARARDPRRAGAQGARQPEGAFRGGARAVSPPAARGVTRADRPA